MIINLSGEVDYKMFNHLVTSFNNLKKEDNIHIYFSSPIGGYIDSTTALIDFINKNKDFIGVTFYGELFSSGMTVFLSLQCEKKILPETTGMYHFAWQSMNISETGKPNGEYDGFVIKEMKKSKIRTLEFLNTTKLSQKEIAQIKLGKDVYFSYDRMLELI